MEIAILGLGCFWGPERKFGEIEGVTNTEVAVSYTHLTLPTNREV